MLLAQERSGCNEAKHFFTACSEISAWAWKISANVLGGYLTTDKHTNTHQSSRMYLYVLHNTLKYIFPPAFCSSTFRNNVTLRGPAVTWMGKGARLPFLNVCDHFMGVWNVSMVTVAIRGWHPYACIVMTMWPNGPVLSWWWRACNFAACIGHWRCMYHCFRPVPQYLHNRLEDYFLDD